MNLHTMLSQRVSVFLVFGLVSAGVHAVTLCTLVVDPVNRRELLREGDCEIRVTPASTFKIPLALMGFDANILQDEGTPAWPFKQGYPDWAGDTWRQTTDPARWMRYSVFWFSQQIAGHLGPTDFQRYIDQFQYGNQDGSGDPGEAHGIHGAWVMSSLKISPAEQASFLSKLVNRQLEVSERAYAMTERITSLDRTVGGWSVNGKTGTGSPGMKGKYDASRAYGWFVGWAHRGPQTVVFAHLIQDGKATQPNAGIRARDQLLEVLAKFQTQ
jgi:beta-lactamase class D